MRSTKNFAGVMTPLLIPFNEHEQVIEAELRAYISILIDKGVDGFLSPSSTGEFANLPLETRPKILQVTVDETVGRIPVTATSSRAATIIIINNSVILTLSPFGIK